MAGRSTGRDLDWSSRIDFDRRTFEGDGHHGEQLAAKAFAFLRPTVASKEVSKKQAIVRALQSKDHQDDDNLQW